MQTSGLKGIRKISELALEGKKVFLRLDLNVPLEDGKISDTTRIDAAIPTIRYLMEAKAKIVIGSHLGRPKKAFDKKYSLEPVAEKLTELLNAEVTLVDDPESDAPKLLIRALQPNQIILLENLRYSASEEKNGLDLAKKIASYCEIYINDAFGASHRAHASIVGLPEMMPEKAIGFLIEKEISMLDKILSIQEHPFTAILGGSKVSDKIGVIENLMDRVDQFVIGGAMAYTFLAAENVPVGKSLVETEKLSFAKEFLIRCRGRDKKVFLPVDHVVANDFENPTSVRTTASEVIPDGFLGLDIGPKTTHQFSQAISRSKVAFWNGPMGVFERREFESGTFGVAKALSEVSGFTFVGGGDSASALQASGYSDRVTHISTGGGASLEYLQGDKLPGLEILRNRHA